MAIYRLDNIGFKDYTLEVTENEVIFYGTTGRILKQKIDKYGYLVINMESATESHTQRVHRVVAKACVANPRNKDVVMHKDNNKLNCHPSNLQWGTYKDNNQQCYRDNRNIGNTKKDIQVKIIKDNILLGGTYDDIINRCSRQGVNLSAGTLTKYKKEMASECND